MIIDKKDICIIILSVMLLVCLLIISGQYEKIQTLESEVKSNREFISTELHLIDSIYDNNYRLWDTRVEQLLRQFENQGYLIQE